MMNKIKKSEKVYKLMLYNKTYRRAELELPH